MPGPGKAVAVWDVGKTNAKICVLDPVEGRVLEDRSKAVAALPGPPYSHLDTESLWSWFKESAAELAQGHDIGSIVTTAHGASAALLAEDGSLALPVLDYEDEGPEEAEEEYAKVRPPFSETLSAPLPCSINYGRGLHWLSLRFPEEFARARQVTSYTQYWSWRLCGVAATECTTIGSHSDLWNPPEGRFSSLVAKMGWERLFPPMRRADEVLGTLLPEVADETGLPPDCSVRCGIHDSNASLLPWLVSRKPPFTVSSTGTWVINLAVGASTDGLDPARDCTTNVSMYGDPVVTTRWMGGREHALITEGAGGEAGAGDLKAAMESEGLMLLPNQGGQAGPFIDRGQDPNEELRSAPGPIRRAAAALYCALMLDVSLDLCNNTGDVIVEGAFSRNELLLRIAAALRPGADVLVSEDVTGTTTGAARLAAPDLPAPRTRRVEPLDSGEALLAYRKRWLEQASA